MEEFFEKLFRHDSWRNNLDHEAFIRVLQSIERDSRPIWDKNKRRKRVGKWMTGFSKKLNRTSTRKDKCRLLSSIERTQFENDINAVFWRFVKFDENHATIYNGKKEFLEETRLNGFQKMLLKSNTSLKNEFLGRSEIQVETGEWNIEPNIEILSEGGEALVLSIIFGADEAAVRIQVFDPMLFTEKLRLDSCTWKIHFENGTFFINHFFEN